MTALVLTTTITCSQAITLLNRIQANKNLLDPIKTELIETIRTFIPTCPVKITKDAK